MATTRYQLFLCFASEQKAIAEKLRIVLRDKKYNVFFSERDILPGTPYDVQIMDAIKRSQLFIFLLSPESIREDKYTFNELQIAQNHDIQIVPFNLFPDKIDPEALPSSIDRRSIVNPRGDKVTGMMIEVDRILTNNIYQEPVWRSPFARVAYGIITITLLLAGFLLYHVINDRGVSFQEKQINQIVADSVTSGQRGLLLSLLYQRIERDDLFRLGAFDFFKSDVDQIISDTLETILSRNDNDSLFLRQIQEKDSLLVDREASIRSKIMELRRLAADTLTLAKTVKNINRRLDSIRFVNTKMDIKLQVSSTSSPCNRNVISALKDKDIYHVVQESDPTISENGISISNLQYWDFALSIKNAISPLGCLQTAGDLKITQSDRPFGPHLLIRLQYP